MRYNLFLLNILNPVPSTGEIYELGIAIQSLASGSKNPYDIFGR